MVTARKANKTLGEHAEAHEAVTRLGSNNKPKVIQPKWTLDNIHENLVGQGIIEYLKRHQTLSVREINIAANRLTKIADSNIKEGKARDFVARHIGYRSYDLIDVTVREAVQVRDQVKRRKAERVVIEEVMDDEADCQTVEPVETINPLLMLALQTDISKRAFRQLGKNYRAFVNRCDPEHPLTLMQAYNCIARVMGYESYHAMPRQYPILNLKHTDH